MSQSTQPSCHEPERNREIFTYIKSQKRKVNNDAYKVLNIILRRIENAMFNVRPIKNKYLQWNLA